jgi:hypothetical protein
VSQQGGIVYAASTYASYSFIGCTFDTIKNGLIFDNTAGSTSYSVTKSISSSTIKSITMNN